MKQTRFATNRESQQELINTALDHPDLVGWLVIVPAQTQPGGSRVALHCVQAWNLHPLEVAQVFEEEAKAMRARYAVQGDAGFATTPDQAQQDFVAREGTEFGS